MKQEKKRKNEGEVAVQWEVQKSDCDRDYPGIALLPGRGISPAVLRKAQALQPLTVFDSAHNHLKELLKPTPSQRAIPHVL